MILINCSSIHYTLVNKLFDFVFKKHHAFRNFISKLHACLPTTLKYFFGI